MTLDGSLEVTSTQWDIPKRLSEAFTAPLAFRPARLGGSFARPSSVAFVATGAANETPTGNIRLGSIFFASQRGDDRLGALLRKRLVAVKIADTVGVPDDQNS